jgi:hypothetical protein
MKRKQSVISRQQSARTEIFLPQRAQRKSGHRDIGTSENQNLPRMGADERGLQGEESSRESEFVPVLGGYGFERVSLRIEPIGTSSHLTPARARAARSGNPGQRIIRPSGDRNTAEGGGATRACASARQSGMSWDGMGYQGRGWGASGDRETKSLPT